MASQSDLLSILVCPACKASLDLVHDGKGLKCVECRRVFPIRDGVPVMMLSEAKVED